MFIAKQVRHFLQHYAGLSEAERKEVEALIPDDSESHGILPSAIVAEILGDKLYPVFLQSWNDRLVEYMALLAA